MESTDFRLIPLSGERGKGLTALVDNRDYDRVSQIKWYLDRDGYAWGHAPTPGGRKAMGMHRYINGTPHGLQTDHVNGRKLDNRRSNLRTASHSENQANRGSQGGVSRYKGVNPAGSGQWQAQVRVLGQIYRFGDYDSEEEAAAAYDAAALSAWGEFAQLNLPERRDTYLPVAFARPTPRPPRDLPPRCYVWHDSRKKNPRPGYTKVWIAAVRLAGGLKKSPHQYGTREEAVAAALELARQFGLAEEQ